MRFDVAPRACSRGRSFGKLFSKRSFKIIGDKCCEGERGQHIRAPVESIGPHGPEDLPQHLFVAICHIISGFRIIAYEVRCNLEINDANRDNRIDCGLKYIFE
jgi:hypothetical protein